MHLIACLGNQRNIEFIEQFWLFSKHKHASAIACTRICWRAWANVRRRTAPSIRMSLQGPQDPSSKMLQYHSICSVRHTKYPHASLQRTPKPATAIASTYFVLSWTWKWCFALTLKKNYRSVTKCDALRICDSETQDAAFKVHRSSFTVACPFDNRQPMWMNISHGPGSALGSPWSRRSNTVSHCKCQKPISDYRWARKWYTIDALWSLCKLFVANSCPDTPTQLFSISGTWKCSCQVVLSRMSQPICRTSGS